MVTLGPDCAEHLFVKTEIRGGRSAKILLLYTASRLVSENILTADEILSGMGHECPRRARCVSKP